MRPNASQWDRMGPNTSESLEKLAKKSKNLAKTSKKFEKKFVKTFSTAQYSHQRDDPSTPAHGDATTQV